MSWAQVNDRFKALLPASTVQNCGIYGGENIVQQPPGSDFRKIAIILHFCSYQINQAAIIYYVRKVVSGFDEFTYGLFELYI
jgi:hypothetical protein